MPIQCSISFKQMSETEFRTLDYKVMKHAFDSQNSIGSLADERVYQTDFAARLLDAGFRVEREVEIVLSHKSFRKSLYFDHVVEQMAVYELKVANALTDAHRSQLLTYLYLLNLERGKLINFTATKIQSEFVNAAIPNDQRIQFSVDRSNYQGPVWFAEIIIDLVRDWGTCLAIRLYHEAVTALLGGADHVDVMLPMSRDGVHLATQRFHLIPGEGAFQLTAINKTNTGFDSHLQRLIRLSPLSLLHWVNIDRHIIKFMTIQR